MKKSLIFLLLWLCTAVTLRAQTDTTETKVDYFVNASEFGKYCIFRPDSSNMQFRKDKQTGKTTLFFVVNGSKAIVAHVLEYTIKGELITKPVMYFYPVDSMASVYKCTFDEKTFETEKAKLLQLLKSK